MTIQRRVSHNLDVYNVVVSIKDFFSYLNVDIIIIIVMDYGARRKQNTPGMLRDHGDPANHHYKGASSFSYSSTIHITSYSFAPKYLSAQHIVGLVNGAIVKFNGFAAAEARDNILYQPPQYMLLKVLHDPHGQIHVSQILYRPLFFLSNLQSSITTVVLAKRLKLSNSLLHWPMR
jgi:hypothetical protein